MTLLAIAHRAGNSLTALRAAAAVGADVVEADVHHRQERLEVRHSKALGPLPYMWDRNPWHLAHASTIDLHLPELLDAMLPDATLMLDLKGIGSVGRRTADLLHERSPDRPVIVCGRWWPAVDAFADRDWAHRVLSARNRLELVRLRRRVRGTPAGTLHGVSLHGSLLTPEVVEELRERVELVMTWGVNDLATLERVTALGVNGVISDSVDVLRVVKAGQR